MPAEGGHPVLRGICDENPEALEHWIPAFAGMTLKLPAPVASYWDRCASQDFIHTHSQHSCFCSHFVLALVARTIIILAIPFR
jgi:hypothetical protein